MPRSAHLVHSYAPGRPLCSRAVASVQAEQSPLSAVQALFALTAVAECRDRSWLLPTRYEREGLGILNKDYDELFPTAAAELPEGNPTAPRLHELVPTRPWLYNKGYLP